MGSKEPLRIVLIIIDRNIIPNDYGPPVDGCHCLNICLRNLTGQSAWASPEKATSAGIASDNSAK